MLRSQHMIWLFSFSLQEETQQVLSQLVLLCHSTRHHMVASHSNMPQYGFLPGALLGSTGMLLDSAMLHHLICDTSNAFWEFAPIETSLPCQKLAKVKQNPFPLMKQVLLITYQKIKALHRSYNGDQATVQFGPEDHSCIFSACCSAAKTWWPNSGTKPLAH